MRDADVMKILGPPDEFGALPDTETYRGILKPDGTLEFKHPDKAPKLGNALIWKYGDIKFHFDRESRQVWKIFSDDFDIPRGGEKIDLDSWAIRACSSQEEMEHALNASGIFYEYKEAPDPGRCTEITLASGVQLSFVDDGMDEEALRVVSPLGLCAVSYSERSWITATAPPRLPRVEKTNPMHWFWRVTIALAAGSMLGLFVGSIVMFMTMPLLSPSGPDDSPAYILSLLLVPQLVAIFVYGYLTRYYGQQAVLERETRCRKCEYILRGISEPRCPECGERI
jgi:hypothetical protein